MSESRSIEYIYLLLPRFVFEPDVKYNDKRHLPEVTRDFKHNGVRFNFVISPALIYNPNDGDKHYYPGERERTVESTLRELAVEENPNFVKSNLTLILRLRYFLDRLPVHPAGILYTADEIELSLHILSGVTYRLDDGKNVMYVRPVEELNRIEENEEIYYYLQFSSIFLGDNQVFNYCFGDKNLSKPKQNKEAT